MGTIPAPNIAELGGQIAAAPQNALAEYARVAQIKQQTAQAAAMAPLQQQQAQQQIEMQRRQMADQDALTKAITQYDPDKHTLSDIPKLITQNGGSGQAALQAQAGLVQQRQNLAKLSEEQFAQEQKKADLIEGVHDTVSNAPPEQKQQAYQQGLQTLGRAGVDVSKEPLQYPGDDVFAQHLPAIRLHSAIVAEAEKDREQTTKEANAAAEQQKANAGDWKDGGGGTLVNVNSKSPDFGKILHGLGPLDQQELNSYLTTPKVPNESLPTAQRTPASYVAWKAKQTPIANFNLQNAGAAADQNGNPSAIAQAIANNQMKWSEAVSPRTPQATKNAIMAQVFKLNPNYDTSEFGLEQDAAKKARSGAWADTRVAYNTAIDHASQLLQAADALKNGDVQKLNSLQNYFKTQFGSPDVSNFNAIANAYNHEVTSVVSKGHITDAEVAQGHATLPDNASPEQIRGVAAAYKNLMQSKRDELDKVIKAGAGSKANGVLGVQSGGAMENTTSPQTAQSKAAGPPAGATHTAMGSDKQLHYTNAQGQDLGVVPSGR